MADAPLSAKLEARRFMHDGQVYLAELRQRRSPDALRADGVTGYDIAISREGRPFAADYGSRGEAGPVAAAYCATMGGVHDDSAAAVFYPARQNDPNAEWVFPGWCRLSEVAA
ncbi:MAG: hypothetical protein Q4G49_04510 [Paracoccus sp. (in: a-proteobacteria)]|nr:hypothetical protein [Paracoccus sp. (in: a-proteobacteria)]